MRAAVCGEGLSGDWSDAKRATNVHADAAACPFHWQDEKNDDDLIEWH